jgi:heme exporter protein C
MNGVKMRVSIIISALLMLASMYMIFVFAPTEAESGDIQRIFYIHVPLAWVSLVAFTFVFVFSVLYLARRSRKFDTMAAASAEVGIIFTSLFLLTGSLWAKPAWGTYWTWDARLTSSLILWFIYLGYLLIRWMAAGEERRARLAAVVAVIGFIDIPAVVLAIVLWRTQHPDPLVFSGGLSGEMALTLVIAIIAFTCLYLLLYQLCFRVKAEQARLDELKKTYLEMD